jgi:hypothetical protein
MSLAMKYNMKKKQAACAEHGRAGCGMCNGGKMAEGGEVSGSVVDRAMAKRNKNEPVADFEPNDFEVVDDHKMHEDADYTGANSGDEIGNEGEDERREDIVSRVMRSRAKKDRNPRPA